MGERDHPWKTDWSVTRVLQTRWPLPPFIPPEALERGSRVHAYTEELDRGAVITPDADVAGWVDAYKDFSAQLRPTWELREHVMEDLEANVHGILDCMGYLSGHEQPCVLDIKTGGDRASTSNPAHAIQTAAYAWLYDRKDYLSYARYGLYLRRDGKWRLKLFDNPNDFRTWEQLLHDAQQGTSDANR
jgi:hypothetical protein